jgi:hypothetical protein
MTLAVSPAAPVVAQRLAALFTRDQALALALKYAHDRLVEANGRLVSGLSAEALRGVYGPEGPDLALSGERPPVLGEDSPVEALEQVAAVTRVPHHDYQTRHGGAAAARVRGRRRCNGAARRAGGGRVN